MKTITRIVRLLKRFNLIDSAKSGYRKKPKFVKFLRRFVKDADAKGFFEEAPDAADKVEKEEEND